MTEKEVLCRVPIRNVQCLSNGNLNICKGRHDQYLSNRKLLNSETIEMHINRK